MLKVLCLLPIVAFGVPVPRVAPTVSYISEETLDDIIADEGCPKGTASATNCHEVDNEMNYLTSNMDYVNPSYEIETGDRGDSPYYEEIGGTDTCCYEYHTDYWTQKEDCEGNSGSLSHFNVATKWCDAYIADDTFEVVYGGYKDWDGVTFKDITNLTTYEADPTICTNGIKWDKGYEKSQDARIYKVCVTWGDIDADKDCLDPRGWYAQKAANAFDFEETHVPACQQGSCASIGDAFNPPHDCRCVKGTDCPSDVYERQADYNMDSYFCHSINLIANRLGAGAVTSDCGETGDEDYVCCCHCDSCADAWFTS